MNVQFAKKNFQKKLVYNMIFWRLSFCIGMLLTASSQASEVSLLLSHRLWLTKSFHSQAAKNQTWQNFQDILPAHFVVDHTALASNLQQPSDAMSLNYWRQPLVDLATGQGVLVGIVDTGIDWRHPAFQDESGHSRLVALWDQDVLGGDPPLSFGYGHYCDAQRIAQKTCQRLGDVNGHGTHVAGIAVGSRSLGGIAPDAQLAVVSSKNFTRLADAVSFLVMVAHQRAQPLVVNISVGGHYGPHNGQTPMEKFLQKLQGPGVIFVAAAGNDGNQAIHLKTTVTARPKRVVLQGLPIGMQDKTLLEFWQAPNDSLELTLELWDKKQCLSRLPLQEALAQNNPQDEADLSTSHYSLLAPKPWVDSLGEAKAQLPILLVSLKRHQQHPLYGFKYLSVLIDMQKSSVWQLPYRLVLRLEGQGQVEAWVSQTQYNHGWSHFASLKSLFNPEISLEALGFIEGDDASSVVVPATSPGILAVGSFSYNKDYEPPVETQKQLKKTLRPNALRSFAATQPFLASAFLLTAKDPLGETQRSFFSSQGPSADLALTGYKPDLCAYGGPIFSAKSLQGADATGAALTTIMQGTSMAAPQVSGLVALMLQKNPTLTPMQVRNILRQTSQEDLSTGQIPNPAWGYGKLHGRNALLTVQQQKMANCQQNQNGIDLLFYAPWLLLKRLFRYLDKRLRESHS